MIVRLKAPIGIITQLDGTTFQFYDSPIKRHDKEGILFLFGRFNSMIVRLKVLDSTGIQPRRRWFQFYDSPIKSACRVALLYAVWLFQFYDSPIKRVSEGASQMQYTEVSIL